MNRKLIKSIFKKYKLLLFAIVIISSLSFGTLVGLSNVDSSLVYSIDDYLDKTKYQDVILTTDITLKEDILDDLKIDGIKDYRLRIATNSVAISPDDKMLSIRAFSFSEKDLDTMFIWDEIKEDKDMGITLDVSFARDNNIKCGDILKIKITDEYREYKVVRIVSVPEAIAKELYNDLANFNTKFGYVYVPESLLVEESKKVKSEASKNVDDKKEELDKTEKDFYTEYNDSLSKLDLYSDEIKGKINEINKYRKLYSELKVQKEEIEKKIKEAKSPLEELKNKKNAFDIAIKQREEILSKIEKVNERIKVINKNISNTNSTYDSKFTSNNIDAIKDLNSNNPNIEIKTVNSVLSNIDEFNIQLKNINKNISGSLEFNTFINKLELITRDIKDDSTYLNSSEVKKELENGDYSSNIKNIIIKYNGSFLTTEINTVLIKLNRLVNYIDTNNIEEKLSLLSSIYSTKTYTEFKNEIKSCLSVIGNNTQIKTAGELFNYYNTETNKKNNSINTFTKEKESLISSLSEYKVTEKNINKKISQIKNTITTYKSASDELNKNIVEINTQVKKGEDSIKTINKTMSDIVKGISEGEKAIKEAQKDLVDKKNLLNSIYLESVERFNEAHEQLNNLITSSDNEHGYEDYYNQILIRFNDSVDEEEIVTNLSLALSSKTKVDDPFYYKDTALKERFEQTVNTVDTLGIFLPFILFFIEIMVIALFISLIIKQNKKEIGLLRALGFKNLNIIFSFLIIMGILTIVSCIIGFVMSIYFSLYVNNFFKDMFYFSKMTYVINYKNLFIAVFFMFLCGQFSTIISSIQIFKISPYMALSSRQQYINYEPNYFWNSLKINSFRKYSLSTMLRNKINFLITTLCIATTISIIFATNGFLSSRDEYFNRTFNKQLHYDAQVVFKSIVDEEKIKEKISDLNISDYYLTSTYDVNIKASDKSEITKVVYANNADDYFTILGEGNTVLHLKDGIILSDYIAEKLNVSEGDKVIINDVTYNVDGIAHENSGVVQYLSDSIKNDFSSGISLLYVKCSDDKKEDLLRKFNELDDYLYTSFTSDILAGTHKLYATFDFFAWIVIIVSSIIGFVIVLNILTSNMIESKRKLSILRIIGFKRIQLLNSLLFQSTLQFIIALLIGLPCGKYLCRITLKQLSSIDKQFIMYIDKDIYLITIALVFVYIFLCCLIVYFNIRRWNLTENVKERE